MRVVYKTSPASPSAYTSLTLPNITPLSLSIYSKVTFEFLYQERISLRSGTEMNSTKEAGTRPAHAQLEYVEYSKGRAAYPQSPKTEGRGMLYSMSTVEVLVEESSDIADQILQHPD